MTSLTAFLFFLTAVTSLSAQNKNSVRGDLEALTDLYSATNGGNWSNNSGWLNGDPSNDWYGVEVDSEGRVIRLDLYKNNLSGELPESIGNLSKLQFFSVKRNPVYSRIPRSIKNWAKAETVMFSSGSDHNLPNENTYNDHPGKSPTSAVAKYYGSIPDVFDKMPNLRILQIAWQENLKGQPYPSTLYRHPSLEILELHGTQLKGTLNDSFNLPEMRRFFIGSNQLEGPLPQSLGTMTKLINLKMGHSDWFVRNTPNVKRFTGPLPSTFSNFSKIRYFFLSNQGFSGEIPGYIVENWSELREIGLDNNNFTGEIPKEFGDFDLTVFSLRSNNFSGTLHPNLVSGMQRVILFNIRRNNLSGDFPNGQMVNGEWKGWRTKSRLRAVTLDHNNFTGPLPDMPEYVGDMSLYTAHNNNFTGGIPDTWEELFTPALRNENPKRTFNNLQLRGNQLQGILPAWFTSKNFDGSGIDVKGNSWSRKDILENGVKVSAGERYDAPQLPFGRQIVYKKSVGSSIEYDYSHKVHSTDKIRWSKLNDSTGEWERDARFNGSGTFSIGNIQESDYGSYRMELMNTRTPLPETVVSEPIIIEESDGSGSDSSGSSDGSSAGADNDGTGDGTGDGGTDDGFRSGTEPFPAAPILFGPDDDSENVSLKPQITWSDIDADYYILHVRRQNPSGKTIDVVVNDTTFTPDEILDDNTVHDWRVRGVKDGEKGEWSEIQRFTTSEENLPDVADLVSPGHSAQNIDPATELSWEDVGADSYEIRIMVKKTSEILFSDVTSDTTYTPIESLPDTTEFVWQVKSISGGVMSAGVHGAWGPRWEFSTGVYQYSVEAPSLIAPGQGSEDSNLVPTFKWEDVDADRYVIIVTRDDPATARFLNGMTNASTTVIHEETTDTTYTAEISLEPETGYYWQVQAVKEGDGDEEDEEGEWSDVGEFTLINPMAQKAVSSQSNEQQQQQPVVTSLDQNYPNPFNPTTRIEFALSGAQKVSLKVYDMAGRQVAKLVDDVLQAGHHSATFDASNLSSGIYIYQFISNSHQFSRKMTLIK